MSQMDQLFNDAYSILERAGGCESASTLRNELRSFGWEGWHLSEFVWLCSTLGFTVEQVRQKKNPHFIRATYISI